MSGAPPPPRLFEKEEAADSPPPKAHATRLFRSDAEGTLDDSGGRSEANSSVRVQASGGVTGVSGSGSGDERGRGVFTSTVPWDAGGAEASLRSMRAKSRLSSASTVAATAATSDRVDATSASRRRVRRALVSDTMARTFCNGDREEYMRRKLHAREAPACALPHLRGREPHVVGLRGEGPQRRVEEGNELSHLPQPSGSPGR